MSEARRPRRLGGIAFVLALLGCAGGLSGIALAGPAGGLRTIRYRGLSVHIPQSWPVFNLARDPGTCVRFDRHALYLGTPSSAQRCPAHAVGRTEALLLSPLTEGRGAKSPGAAGLGLDGNATSFAVSATRVEVTATWLRAKRVLATALGRSSLPASRQQSALAPDAGAVPSAPNAPAGTGAYAPARSAATVYTGRGFDACTAPSRSQMSAWLASPYRGVGAYIGGINEACSQPNLSAGWIQAEMTAGWHLIPTYVSLQAPINACGCASMSTNTTTAKAQGAAAASDAVAQAQHYGLPAHSPIYDDMEGYTPGSPNTPAVLAFLSGWTSKLHSYRYRAGVYSSAGSGIRDLVHKYGTSYPEPDDIWIANWDGVQTVSDPSVPASDWRNHQRLHQYAGNTDETYGGVTLNVDDDYLDGATASAGAGYRILTSDGGVHQFGPVHHYGSDAGRLPAGVTAVALASDPKTGGYWILRSDGGVDSFHAPSYGSLQGKLAGRRPVALAASTRGGYLVLTSNGGVHRFGPSPAYGGDAGKLPAGVTAVAAAVDRKTGGYWILKSDGGVNGFHAPWDGSLRGKLAGTAAAALAAARQGGYYVLTSDGTVYPFGLTPLYGSDAGKLPTGVRAISLATAPNASGYRILRSDGGVNSFDQAWYGSLVGKVPAGTSPHTIASATR